jgi:hypothetical protein
MRRQSWPFRASPPSLYCALLGTKPQPNLAWEMCYFNNSTIAVQRIRPKAERVLLIDIDLHFGDGTLAYFGVITMSRLSIPDRWMQTSIA